MSKKPFCRKCLLDELDEDEYILSLKDYIAKYPQEKRCSEKEYQRRLNICLTCKHLSNATCALCGCYVELRALKKEMYCPDCGNKWRKNQYL